MEPGSTPMESFNQQDRALMTKALDLAREGVGLASPNPCVGAVIVQDQAGQSDGPRIVGSGFHRYQEKLHAEVIALRAAGEAARGATLYINLEPCSHTGRTPPCSEAVIRAGIKRVVVAMPDPNPLVSGQGIAQLRAAGVLVDVGLLQPDALELNAAFCKWIVKRTPLATLKAGMSLDGHIAPPRREGDGPQWLSSPQSRTQVQVLRHASDAILTGIGTVLADDPLLTDRSGRPRRRPLLRVIVDSRLRIPENSKLVQTCQHDLLVVCAQSDPGKTELLRKAGVEVLELPNGEGQVDLPALFALLGRRDVLSVLCEGGERLNTALLRSGCLDRLLLFVAPTLLGGGPCLFQDTAIAAPLKLRDARIHHCGPDIVIEGALGGHD